MFKTWIRGKLSSSEKMEINKGGGSGYCGGGGGDYGSGSSSDMSGKNGLC